jgi:putative hydrolase of the HAD superfamily
MELLHLSPAPDSDEKALNEWSVKSAAKWTRRQKSERWLSMSGGTLIEPWPSVGHVYAGIAARNGVTGVSPEALTARFKSAWRNRKSFAYTRSAWSELVDETFRDLCSKPPSTTFFPDLYEHFAQPQAWRIFDDVLPALRKLASANLRLAVISNWDERLRPLLDRLELGKYFQTIIVSCEIGAAKPSPLIFEAAAKNLQLPPASILHVGDDFRVGRERRAGGRFSRSANTPGRPSARGRP